MKRICRYIQAIKDNGLVLNLPKKVVVDCYADAYFSEMWGNGYLQDPILARSRTIFVVIFANCPLLWVSKLQTEISLSTLHSEYMALSNFVRALLPLKIIIKEVIENLGIYSQTLKFVSSSTIYEENKGSIVVETSAIMTPTSKHIAVKYHWFRQHVGKEFVIRKIESENQKADILTNQGVAIKGYHTDNGIFNA